MFLLEFGNLGLHVLHGLGGVELLYGQGIHQPADNNGQGYNGQPEVAKKNTGQRNNAVNHGLENNQVPNGSNIQLKLPLRLINRHVPDD